MTTCFTWQLTSNTWQWYFRMTTKEEGELAQAIVVIRTLSPPQ